ncbi:fimbria/pilus outer membrane usher protein [Lysobacter sp. A6]|uniref:Fimbria/pilus outer membrane usher protein n=1 Tax=Noviluteimonas lactosilytica TaxID=2888523 RepID=A0ABS8JDJ8_9GAMM|nr:fimbria/pilus outer membrane usher protein [Lysobacter lactosilyticus]MCC8361669.1 fimbria/pilus outer membrane usher protein [Lysobacter lactosilyticus]
MRPLNHARRAVLAIALACAIAPPALALPGDETLLLDICINNRCIGIAPVIARGDDVLVDLAALRAAALDTQGVVPEQLGERQFVSLRQLNHGSTFKIDRTLLRLDLKLRADRLPRQRVAMTTREQSEAGLQAWSAFVNYGASMNDDGDGTLFLDGAVGRGYGALRSTGQWDSEFGWRRGLTRLEYDQPDAVRRWTIGDQYATPRDPLGGGRLLGGVGVERAFDTDPYLVTFPRPYFSGVLESPGTVEVYSNGALIGRRDLAAGPFTLEQLGIQPGRNDVRVIVRDPFGNRSELATQSYYGGSARLLARGLDEYAVRIGAPREGAGLGGDYDGDVAYQAWYRRGLSDWLTLGGRVEGDERVRNAGVDTAFSTPIGEFALALAGSDADRIGNGQAHAINYTLAMRTWSAGLGTRRANAGYRNMSDPAALLLGPLRVEDYASFAFTPDTGWSLMFNAGRQQRDGQPLVRSWSATGSMRLGSRTQMLVSAQRLDSDLFRDTTLQFSVNIALDRDNVNIGLRQHDDGTTKRHGYGFDANRSRPADTGFGYTINAQRDEERDSAFAMVEYQGTHARFALDASDHDGDTSGSVFASGALVGIGGRVFATPPVESGFALVRVPGLANVPILRENQVVGRTDANGDLLVRDLLPYHANRVGLDQVAVPVGHALETPERSVRVARNTGSLITLEAPSVQATTGRFRYANAHAGDEARIGDTTMPLGTDGLFYFEHLGAGPHVATIAHANGQSQCRFDVPAGGGDVTNVGDIVCEETP